MQTVNFHKEIAGEKFPAGRLTKVVVGPNSKVTAENFVQGYVTIYPGGSVPEHRHANEEVYTIISGRGEMMVNGQTETLEAGSAVYIPPGQAHSLTNNSDQDLIMIFVYSPANIVDHWEEERKGLLK